MKSILIGKIINTHGIKGELKVYPYTDDIDHLTSLKEIYMDEALHQKCIIDSVRVHQNLLIVKLHGIDTMNDAESLKTNYLYIPKSSLRKLEKDTYYIDDLIGLTVIDEHMQEIGTLEYVFNTGANDVYEVKLKEGKMIYLPAIEQVIKKIDLANGKMYIKMMEGLL